MSRSYDMVLDEGTQTGREGSFLGGRPKLPPGSGIPGCSLCGALQTFLLQIAFPPDHAWAGHTVAVFVCTSCADRKFLIPEMVTGPLHGAEIAASFLVTYQRNFRFLVFRTDTGVLATSYTERVRFRPVRLVSGNTLSLGRVGGAPRWIEEDETPGSISSNPAVLLFQLAPNLEFETIPGSPHQVEISLFGTPEPSPDAFYRLFIGNVTYLFGSDKPAPDAVYAITQVA